MKSIFTFVLLLAFAGCSNGQSSHSKNLSKDILGCWELYSEEDIVESNFPRFDSLALKKLNQKAFDNIQKKKFIQKFKDPYIYDKETGEKEDMGTNENASITYKIKADSICINTIEGYRKNTNTTQIHIINDTLYSERDIKGEVDRIHTYASIRETLEFPEDFKITKAVKKGKFVRVKNCDN